MWFADLSRWTYRYSDPKLLAVGWLERGRPFATGAVDSRVYDALREMLKNPWQPFVAMGLHECDLCQLGGTYGVANLYIPGDGVVYVCPELIVHYINAHGYAPPEAFCRAVVDCPPMRSMQYLRALSASGGGVLLRPAGGAGDSWTILG